VNITNLKEWSRIFGFRQVPVWYQSSQETISEFNTIGKHLKILKFVPNPFPFYDWIMGFYERPSNRKALKGPVIERAQKIIDVGVGTGYLLSQLVKVTSEKQQIIAVDLSQQMLKNSRRYLRKNKLMTERIHFKKGNCLNLPWPDNSFDLYVSSYLFDLLPEPELRKAIIDMERVLRPDGYAILITMTTELDGVNKITKQIYRIMNEIYCIGYHKGRWNAVWKFLFAGYAPHCRPIELGKYLRESPRMIIAYTKISHVSFFPVRIYYLRKGHD
jgi:ubiquinone/menaquinone biosynthesis C-methylase UbiE